MFFEPVELLGNIVLTRRNFFVLSGAFIVGTAGIIPAFADNEDPTSLINALRAQNNRGPLAPDSQLEKMAQDQANLMADAQRVAHTISSGNDFVTRLRKFGIHGAAGENLCAGRSTVSAAYNVWMNSPGHRSNMLYPSFHYYGLAKATSPKRPNYVYWAMEFKR